MAINAALTLMCLGFLAGFLLVLSFLQKPVLPIMTAPHTVREHESDVRWTHSQLQGFIRYVGINVLLPVTLLAFVAAAIQMISMNYDVIAVLVSVGLSGLLAVICLAAGPAMRRVRDTKAYEADLDTVTNTLFRMVRLHHGMFLAVIPLMLAQLFLLFM